MSVYYRWYKYNKENDMVEVTKDLFPDGNKYINKENGWSKFEDIKLTIPKEKLNEVKK